MRPWKRIVADVLLDVAEAAERAAKALREEPEPDDLRRRVAELEQRQDRHQADLLKMGSGLKGVARSLDLLREWARQEGLARRTTTEGALTYQQAEEYGNAAILAARKAGGQ